MHRGCLLPLGYKTWKFCSRGEVKATATSVNIPLPRQIHKRGIRRGIFEIVSVLTLAVRSKGLYLWMSLGFLTCRFITAIVPLTNCLYCCGLADTSGTRKYSAFEQFSNLIQCYCIV